VASDLYFADEFPHDNPDLFQVRAPNLALDLLAGVAVMEDHEEEIEIEIVEEFDDFVFESPKPPPVVAEVLAVLQESHVPVPVPVPVPDLQPEPVAEAPTDITNPFETYLSTLAVVALEAGASRAVVDLLPQILGAARLDVQGIDDATVEALVTAKLLSRTDTGAVARNDSLVTIAMAWKSAMAGEEPDFSLCTRMLDEWSADIVASLAAVPQRSDSIRRELRSRGVAAFGLLAA